MAAGPNALRVPAVLPVSSSSTDRNHKKGRGTAFAVYRVGTYIYYLTCDHVLDAVDPKHVQLGGQPGRVVARGGSELDLALVCQVNDVPPEPLPFTLGAKASLAVEIDGFRPGANSEVRQPLRAVLMQEIGYWPPRRGAEFQAWHCQLCVKSLDIVEGYSGGPVLCHQTKQVVGVAYEVIQAGRDGRILGVEAVRRFLQEQMDGDASSWSLEDRWAVTALVLHLDGRDDERLLLDELWPCLNQVTLAPARLRELRFHSCSALQHRSLSAPLNTAADCVLHLWNMMTSGTREPHPVLRFLHWLLQEEPCKTVAQHLAGWLERAYSAFIHDPDDRAAVRDSVKEQSQPPAEPDASSTLLVQVAREAFAGEQSEYRVRTWLRHAQRGWCESPHAWQAIRVSDSRPWDQVLGPVVNKSIKWALGQEVSEAGLQIEVVWPWALLSQALDQWARDSSFGRVDRVGWRFPTVVRALERMEEPHLHHAVRDRWGYKSQAGEAQNLGVEVPVLSQDLASAMAWAWPAEACPTLSDLQGRKALVAAALTRIPAPEKTPPHAEQLAVLLEAGVPALLWARPGTTCSEAELDEFKQLLLGSLEELPLRVREFRRRGEEEKTQRNPGHLAHHVTLVWDHPDHWPPALALGTHPTCE